MTELNGLNATLNAIPAADVRRPDRPVATFIQQNNDLATYIQGEVLEKLSQVGFGAAQVEAYKQAIGALQAAESAWQAARKIKTPQELVALEQEADTLRRDVVAALRWNLRDDRNAQATLTLIQEGEGVADLAMDLETLGALMAANVEAFVQDQTFNVGAQVEAVRIMAARVREAFSLEKADDSATDLRDLRDRAFTWLDGFWDDARRAGRYVFRNDPERLAHFRDGYGAVQKRRQRVALPSPVAG